LCCFGKRPGGGFIKWRIATPSTNQETAMSSLGEFHHEEEGPTKAHKIVGGIVIALIVGGITFYVLDSGMLDSHPSQTAKAYPRGL
jgi:hypothetical protein